MAVAPKTARSPAPTPSPAEAKVDLPAAPPVPEPVNLDFAANPNHYRAKVHGKVEKAKPRQGPQVDSPPRLELNVQCDAAQEQDSDKE
jgi:hypothetical protein